MFLNDLRKLRLDLWRCHGNWECLCHVRLFLHSVATKPAAKDKELFVACCCHIRWKTRKSFVKYQQESRVMEMVKGVELTQCSDRKLSTEATQQSICILITSPAPHYFFKKSLLWPYFFQPMVHGWFQPFPLTSYVERIFTPSLRIMAMLRGVALLGGTPPEVLATLPREEELPLTDRQDRSRVRIKEVAQIAVPSTPKQWTVRWFFHKSS